MKGSRKPEQIEGFHGSYQGVVAGCSVLRGSGYLGYVDSNQGYNPYKWVICPLTRVINLHITSYLPYPEPLSSFGRVGFWEWDIMVFFFQNYTLKGSWLTETFGP